MYKERVKSGFNPIIALILWAAGTYLFVILWGISQILFEFEFEMLKVIICLAGTIVFSWFLITKLIAEYEFVIHDRKLHISKIISKRKATVVKLIATDNIVGIYNSKEKAKNHGASKIITFTCPRQKEAPVYIVYKDSDKISTVKISASKKLVNALKYEKRKREEPTK